LTEKTISKLKEIAHIVYINIRHVDEKTREFSWSNINDRKNIVSSGYS